jgi:hypothetical protein
MFVKYIMYLSSTITKTPSGLIKVTITSSWFYFGTQTKHETFLNIAEAKAWLLYQRCGEIKIDDEPSKISAAPVVNEKFSYADKVKLKQQMTK